MRIDFRARVRFNDRVCGVLTGNTMRSLAAACLFVVVAIQPATAAVLPLNGPIELVGNPGSTVFSALSISASALAPLSDNHGISLWAAISRLDGTPLVTVDTFLTAAKCDVICGPPISHERDLFTFTVPESGSLAFLVQSFALVIHGPDHPAKPVYFSYEVSLLLPDNVSLTPIPAALPFFVSVLVGGAVIAWRRKSQR
jgi:hypothetical protein